MRKEYISLSYSIGLMYDGALQGKLFSVVLDMFARQYPNAFPHIYCQYMHNQSVNSLFLPTRNTDYSMDCSRQPRENISWQHELWNIPVGTIYTSDEFLDHYLPNGELVSPWPSNRERAQRFCGVVFARSEIGQFSFEVHFSQQEPIPNKLSIQDFFTSISPHLVKAASVEELRSLNHINETTSQQVVERFPFATLLISPNGKVLSASSKAQAKLTQSEDLYISPESYLRAKDSEFEGRLRATLRDVATSPRAHGETLAYHNETGATRYSLGIFGLRQPSTQNAVGIRAFDGKPHQLLVVIHDRLANLSMSHDTLWKLFQLTTSEAELSLALLAGDTIGSLAVKGNSSKQTLRNQLMATMKKTKTNRQPELIALLTRLALAVE